jgi:hypothetical protein
VSPAAELLLSGSLTLGVPAVILVREVFGRSRRRTNGGDGGGQAQSGRSPPPLPSGSGAPDKPLPACLLPPYPPMFEDEADGAGRMLEREPV